MLLPKVEDRAITPPHPPHPLGEQEGIPGKNLQESPNPGATRFGTRTVIAIIGNQQFNTPRGEQHFKFKREIQVLNFWHGGGDTYALKKLNSSRRAHLYSDLTKWIDRRLLNAFKF